MEGSVAVKKRRSGKDTTATARVAAQEPLVEKHEHPTTAAVAATTTRGDAAPAMTSWIQRQPLWIILAVASGICAAVNGVFAKLTTTSLTSTLSSTISHALGLSPENTYVDIALRSTFFGLNVVFNIIMWTLFTAALTRSNSTTRVSIVNVSSNFFVTAVLGAMIFGEKLPLGWWLGAGMLAAGNIVIGRRKEEGEDEVGKEDGIQQQQSSTRGREEEGGGEAAEAEPLIELER